MNCPSVVESLENFRLQSWLPRPDLLLTPRMCEDGTVLQHLPPSLGSLQGREALWNFGQLGPPTSSGLHRISLLCDSKCYEVEPAAKSQGPESPGQIAFDEFWDIYTIILRQLSCGHYERMFHSGSVSEFYNSGQWGVVEGKIFYMHAVSGKCHYDRPSLAAKKHESTHVTGLARPAINRLNGQSRREARRQRLDQIWSKSMSPTVNGAVPLTPSFTGEAVHDRMHREASTRHLDKIWSKSTWTSTGKI